MIQTRSGLFSAIIYRAVTYGNRFLLHPITPTVYADPEDWDLACSQHNNESNDPSYFCDKTAYGQATNLSPKNLDRYWRSTDPKNKALTEWLYSLTKSYTFLEVYEIFLKGKGPDGKKAFPNCGSLISYLLTLDYAIAGIVPMPTAEEMGAIMWSLKKGRLKGLKFLGFAAHRKVDAIHAFVTFHRYMLVKIPFQQRSQMDFNIFHTEHFLCKFRRNNIKVFFQRPGISYWDWNRCSMLQT